MPNLKQWRQSLGLHQHQAARLLGIPQRTYARYENGQIPAHKLAWLSGKLGAPL